MRLASIQGRLSLLFLAFFLLVTVSATATIWGIDAQKKDALVINLAGRQRMLVQQMTRLALEIESEAGQNEAAVLRGAAKEAARMFDQTLPALGEGGPAPYLPGQTVSLPPARDAEILAHLVQVSQTWMSLHSSLDVVLNAQPGSVQLGAAVRSVEAISPQLMAQADAVVRLYEAASSRKVERLKWIQAGFFAAALLLLASGALLTRQSILKPLRQLGAAAESLGRGDLYTPVVVSNPSEVKFLAEKFESAREQLQVSREELLAWTNALEARVAERTQEVEALYQVSREISSRLDVQHVLQSVTEKARQLLGSESAFLCLVAEDREMLNLQATSGPPEAVAMTATPLQNPLPSRVLAGEQALPCGLEGCVGTCGIVEAQFRASQLAAPLKIGASVVGALCVGSSQRSAFSGGQVNLLTRLANSAAIALKNARLYAQAERLAVLEERQRIAAEMHDGLAQTLNYLRLAIDLGYGQIENRQPEQALATLQRTQQALDQAEREVRRAIASLQEDFPLYFTLQEQLARLATEFSGPAGQVQWQTSLHVPINLSQQETEQVLRVAREALINACHHSRARQICLSLEKVDGQIAVTVTDDGQGFEPQSLKAEAGRQHFGLKIMQARAARLGGNLSIQSIPGSGTRVTLTLPVDRLISQGTYSSQSGNASKP